MTLDEAIEHFKRIYWAKTDEDGVEFSQLSRWLTELKELRKLCDSKLIDNRPLTPRELMSLDGEVVWVKTQNDYVVSQCMVVDSTNQVCGSLLPGTVLSFVDGANRNCAYWDLWTAYRLKQEDQEE